MNRQTHWLLSRVTLALAMFVVATAVSIAHQVPVAAAAVALPPAPAVIIFRGGSQPFNGTSWGGAPPPAPGVLPAYDAVCEGLARQATGLMNAMGAPKPVPAGQQIKDGKGNVIGFNDGKANGYVAYNMDVSTFGAAFAAIPPNANVYVCTHGDPGLIYLERGAGFSGFASGKFPNGTDGPPAVRPGSPPYPGLAAIAGVNATLHSCFSLTAAVGKGQRSVATSLTPLVGKVVRGHVRIAYNNFTAVGVAAVPAPVPPPTANEMRAANVALASILGRTQIASAMFGAQYMTAQSVVNAAFAVANNGRPTPKPLLRPNVVVPRITYVDNGDTPAPNIKGGINGCGADCGCGPVAPVPPQPLCVMSALLPGPPTQLQVTVQAAAGLLAIGVTQDVNATVNIPSYSIGGTGVVTVSATKVDQSQPSNLGLSVTDANGTVINCDPALATVGRGTGTSPVTTLTGIAAGEHLMQIWNGQPGIITLVVVIDHSRSFVVSGMTPNEHTTIDVASALTAAEGNTITLAAASRPSGEASVLLSDS